MSVATNPAEASTRLAAMITSEFALTDPYRKCLAVRTAKIDKITPGRMLASMMRAV
jgi:hypothetical protein